MKALVRVRLTDFYKVIMNSLTENFRIVPSCIGTFYFGTVNDYVTFVNQLRNACFGDWSFYDPIPVLFGQNKHKEIFVFMSKIIWDEFQEVDYDLPSCCAHMFENMDVFNEWAIIERLLLLSGDVEMNPGPVCNVRLSLEVKLQKRIERLERARERQLEKNKTLVRKLRQERKRFAWQMNSVVGDVRSFVQDSNVWKTAGYAAANFVLPGSGTVTATVVEGSKLSQTLNDVKNAASRLSDTCSTRIPELLATHVNLADVATMTMQNINGLVAHLSSENGPLSRLTGIASKFFSTITSTAFVVSLIVCLVALTLDWKVACATIFLVLLYFNWPENVVEKIRSILGVGNFKWNSFEDSYHLIGQVLFTLLAFFGVSKIPQDRFYDSILKRLDAIPKAVNGANKIWDQAGKMFDIASDEFRIFFLREKREDVLREKGVADEVRVWIDRVKHYLDAKQRNLLARDEACVKEVEALFYQMYRWKHTPSLWKGMSSDCQRIISSAAPLVQDLYKFACRSTVHEGGPRKAPLAVLFSGDSGRGKSELLYPLAMTLLSNRGCNMQNARNEIYVRNYETEYWDGYVGQKIVFFDDAFQMRDSPGNPSPEFMEAIRLINTAPAHIHCADLNDKGRFFSSEICIYTTNLKENFSSFIQSINCPEAATRRLNANAYRIKTCPDFEKVVTVKGVPQRRLDASKILDCEKCEQLRIRRGLDAKLKFCPHVQLFDRYDLITDEVLQNDMTWSQVVSQLKEFDSALVTDEDRKMFMYEKLIENPDLFCEDEMVYQMNDEEEFFEAATDCGAIDLKSPTDVVAYKSLTDFVMYLSQNGINDVDRIESEIAAHYSLWNTYQRMQTYGVKRYEESEDSLLASCSAADIAYNHQAHIYHSSRNLKFTFKNVYDSFCKYVSRLGSQLSYIWEHSGLTELIGFVYLGLALLSMAGAAYFCFSAEKCPICHLVPCECIRVTSGGYLCQGQLYPFDQFSLESAYDAVNKITRMKIESKYEQVQRQVKMRVETAYDGVSKIPQIRIESTYDGVQKPQQFKVENQYDGPIKQQKMQVEMYADGGCEALESKVLRTSLYLMHDDVKPLGNVLFLKGNVFLMNYHYLEILKKKKLDDDILYLSNRSGRLVEFTFGELSRNFVRLEKTGDQIDAVLVWLDPVRNRVSAHCDVVKHFVTNGDLQGLTGKYNAQLPTYNSSIHEIIQSKRSVVDVEMDYNKVRIDDNDVHMELNTTWRYYGNTSFGDCGAPLILNHASAARKILGIHMASNGFYGLAQTITQEMINKAMESVPRSCQNYVEIDIACDPILPDDLVCDSVPLTKGLMIHGKTIIPVSSGAKTKIKPSPFYGYVEPLTKPAFLHRIGDIDPMYNGLVKYGKEVPRIDPKLIAISVNDIRNNIDFNMSRRDIEKYQRILTYDEALLGVDGDEFLAPINRSTSMGYPYASTIVQPRGKRKAFGDDEWTMNTDLAKQIRVDVEILLQNCRDGKQTGVYWSDTLKDERRPIAKVDAGKTRVFCGGPVHFTIAFRQYFLGFAAWIMHNRNHNEVSVGTNVFSGDWNDIVRKLASRAQTRKGMNVVAGDFSNFDGSLSSQILWAILDMINDWYDDGEENRQIRNVLWMNIVHAIHINRNVIYQTTHSQPSGCPITAILNSLYNSVIVRIAYIFCAESHFQETGEDFRSMKSFAEFVAMVSYGDDNIVGICERIIDWFNQVTITAALALIGHEYTDEAKTGIIVPFRDISEIAYLKRSFVWNPRVNRYIAPLNLDVIREIVQWTKHGTLEHTITLANLDVTMRELSLHDSIVFNEYCAILRKECQRLKITYRFLTQDEYLALVLEEPLLEANNMNVYDVCLTSRSFPRNYIFVDYRRGKLLVNKFDNLIEEKVRFLCCQRNIVIGKVEPIFSFKA